MIRRDMPTYDITLVNQKLDVLQKRLKEVYNKKPLFIITDENVAKLYQKTLKDALSTYTCHFIVIKPEETSKNIATYQFVIEKLIAKGIKRDHFILAFGGGVIGDLAGFVAATLYRGIKYAQIPTTLLAQVDSAIGSKVAIDLDAGKNLIGSFYDPVFVFIDRYFLKTLPKRELKNGIAEIIKAGLINNRDLFEQLLTHPTIDESIIIQALDVKRNLVLNDPCDQNERNLLNFGHTFGHAIEKAHHYQTYKHGEAISYGMLIAVEIGIKLGVTPKEIYPTLKQLLLDYQLVFEPLLEAKDYLEYIKTDKKHLSSGLRFVLLKDIGAATWQTIKVADLL